MNSDIKFPIYVNASIVFVGLCAFIGMLYFAQGVIVPIIYSTIIAIALSPLVSFFVRKKLNRILAIATSLVLVSVVIVLFMVFLSSQVSLFTDSFPKFMEKFYETLTSSILWASKNFNISTQNINSYLEQTIAEVLNRSRLSMGATLTSIGQGLIVSVLIPVYVFMILFYKPLLLDFIRSVSGTDNQKKVNEVLYSTKTIVQKYLVALLLEASIVATLNSIGFLVIGIDYAILLGIIGAILNVIPYIGGIIGVTLPMIIAFVSKDSVTYPLMVLGVYLLIQFIDNNFIIPRLVAGKVKINALVSMIVVIIGGALWGVPGMFLSIPLTAILKIICGHIDKLKPFGFLLGDTMPAMVLNDSKNIKHNK